MKLIDIVLTCSDEMNINVYDNDCELISWHDGKTSIDEELNDRIVTWIYPAMENQLNIGLA